MGRHSSFNKQQVLADALDLFWSRGFTASSLKHLEEVTDMHPGSLYYHFTNKEQLYIASLKHYQEWYLQPRIKKYLLYSQSKSSLRRFFTVGYRNDDEYKFRNCCFVVCSSNDLHLLPKPATEIVRQCLEEIQQAFLTYLNSPPMTKLAMNNDQKERLSCELLNLYLSLQLRARMSPNQHELDKQVKFSLQHVFPTGEI